MPVYKKKQDCTQADGDKGTYTLYHKKKNGKEEKVGCATSKEKAQNYIQGSYADWDWKKSKNKNKKNVTESLTEIVTQKLLEYIQNYKENEILDEDEISEIDDQFDQNWGKY
jgi:hypothetical protein